MWLRIFQIYIREKQPILQEKGSHKLVKTPLIPHSA